jgi:hypothetical protein
MNRSVKGGSHLLGRGGVCRVVHGDHRQAQRAVRPFGVIRGEDLRCPQAGTRRTEAVRGPRPSERHRARRQRTLPTSSPGPGPVPSSGGLANIPLPRAPLTSTPDPVADRRPPATDSPHKTSRSDADPNRVRRGTRPVRRGPAGWRTRGKRSTPTPADGGHSRADTPLAELGLRAGLWVSRTLNGKAPRDYLTWTHVGAGRTRCTHLPDATCNADTDTGDHDDVTATT